MKVKRMKAAERNIWFYKTHFNIGEPPYKVLIDGTFCKAALSSKVDIQEQLPKYLRGEVQLYTTPCALAECESLGSTLYGPLKVLQQYTVLKCKHPAPVLASKCVFSFVKDNTKGYFVATQDKELSSRLRMRSGVPLLFISFHAITLEKPSDTSKDVAAKNFKSQVTFSSHEQETLQRLKAQVFGVTDRPIRRRKKKGLKGPNPLSCRSKKPQSKSSECTSQTKPTANRKKKRKSKKTVV